MELMFILKLLTPHWLSLGLRSSETPADSLSLFAFFSVDLFPLFLFPSHSFSSILYLSLITICYVCFIVCDVPHDADEK